MYHPKLVNRVSKGFASWKYILFLY